MQPQRFMLKYFSKSPKSVFTTVEKIVVNFSLKIAQSDHTASKLV